MEEGGGEKVKMAPGVEAEEEEEEETRKPPALCSRAAGECENGSSQLRFLESYLLPLQTYTLN